MSNAPTSTQVSSAALTLCSPLPPNHTHTSPLHPHPPCSCLPLPESWLPHHGVRLTCPPGKYNDLGTALLGSDVWVIRTLLNLGGEDMPVHKSCSLWSPCYFSWPSLALLSASYLLLMALASSLCLPGGLFMPSIISGGAFGALFGFFLRRVLPSAWDIQPGVYALLCATAVLGGVFRSTFSLVVIVVEGTRGERGSTEVRGGWVS